VLYALYERSGHRGALEEALKANRAARAAWAELAEAAKDVYVHDITFGPEYFQRGNWLDRLPAMDDDIADMEKLLKPMNEVGAASSDIELKVIEQAIRLILTKPKREEHPRFAELHIPPPSFQRGQPLSILARTPQGGHPITVSGLRLRYRRVNQAEAWRMIEMERSGADYHAVIAADYTDSSFPLQYHFQVRADSGHVWLHPGLQPGWRGQPYFIVRQS
jgi:hypothetical protein